MDRPEMSMLRYFSGKLHVPSSGQKLPFHLPAVFTVGPAIEDPKMLLLYAKLMSPHDKLSDHIKELVQGIIEGETRVLAASMTMEQIFKGTKEFKREVFEKVQLELNQFGLLIYNANVKQLVDVPGHEYFSYLGQKTQMEAANQAKVDVAEAKMKGSIGAKEREGLTIQNAARIDAETKIMSTQREGQGMKEAARVRAEVKIYENKREAEMSEANAELAAKNAGWMQQAKLVEVEANKRVALRVAELQTEVERKNALTRKEKLRAELLSKASVDYDIKVQEANSKLYEKQKAAEAILFQNQQDAEAKKLSADADLYSKKKEAEAMTALANAQGYYLTTLLKALNGNYAALRDYLMIDRGMFVDIAKTNAEALKGLQPKISVWSGSGNGAGSSNGSDGMKEIAGVYGMLPPLLQTVHEQTGMLPPAWLGSLPAEPSNNTG